MKRFLLRLADLWEYYFKRKHVIAYDVMVDGKMVKRHKKVSDWYVFRDSELRRHGTR